MSQPISFQYPERVRLAQTPTPLEKMERLSGKFGVDIYGSSAESVEIFRFW